MTHVHQVYHHHHQLVSLHQISQVSYHQLVSYHQMSQVCCHLTSLQSFHLQVLCPLFFHLLVMLLPAYLPCLLVRQRLQSQPRTGDSRQRVMVAVERARRAIRGEMSFHLEIMRKVRMLKRAQAMEARWWSLSVWKKE